ncbi:hypothetical protein [Kitasatospora sp. HPMI-4]|uniref:hypothetical protein n=1 Tax=Kitasatospora sp. HPMI-4 TaxID=3448443 RepID=UPI003F1B02B6
MGFVVGFGEVVQAYGVGRSAGDAFGAVEDGGEGGFADEAGEAADASGGALVEVGGVAGQGAGPVPLKVEGRLHVADQVGERSVGPEAGRESADLGQHGVRVVRAPVDGCGGERLGHDR